LLLRLGLSYLSLALSILCVTHLSLLLVKQATLILTLLRCALRLLGLLNLPLLVGGTPLCVSLLLLL
jgi:hypothetical protein